MKITWEDDDAGFGITTNASADFEALLADNSGNAQVREGMIVKGLVVRLTDDNVVIDIGHKSDGEVPKHEFGANLPKVGDKIDVFLDRFEDGNGEMVLSRERAEMLRAWDRAAEAFEKQEIVEGTIVSKVKGGLSVDIGIKAFLPGSQVDLRPVRNIDKLIGAKLQFKIIRLEKSRGNIILSRRALLEQDRESLRAVTLSKIKEGESLKGIVKNITDYGAFIDLGGIDGLLHITDMSWGRRVSHPSEIFEVGQEINVKVLSYDEERKRVSLGYKQLLDDPWNSVGDKFQSGQKTKGKIVNLTDYGAFVELEGNIEGLIHVSEMSWSKRVRHPSKVVNLGDEVEVVVLAIDLENRRISLGMKQMEQNPWELVKEKYLVGDVIRGKIRNITDFGVFVGIEDGIDGLIHISDISWTDRIKHPGDMFKKGDEVEAKVLAIDIEGEKFSLGIKQLSQDPWVEVAKAHPAGTKASGKVTKVEVFGAFVELAPGIEGMIHVSELSDQNVAKADDVVKEGDQIEFIVLATDADERKFALSRRALLKGLLGEELKQYISNAAGQKTAFAEAFTKAQTN